MSYGFKNIQSNEPHWNDWKWQFKNSLKSKDDFNKKFSLYPSEQKAFEQGKTLFRAQITPYYSELVGSALEDPIRRMIIPRQEELEFKVQQQFDPLGERKKQNRPTKRLIHRYPDRALLLLTDMCSVYCRFCTRKNFTATDEASISNNDLAEAIAYIKSKPGIREILLSGGDPLTVGDSILEKVIGELRSIEHVEIIRIASRMPVVAPMRITDDLIKIFKKNKPIFFMTHFNHPREITWQSANALESLVDNGVPVFNQMVLLNGVNNHPAIVQAVSRRLLYLRVKPYYLFQCDPSMGTDHLRNSIDDSLKIQKELWGNVSGLAMPTYVVDIPDGGGKVPLVPNYQTLHEGSRRSFIGWDGVETSYLSPDPQSLIIPMDLENYLEEWNTNLQAKL